jgi:hypothetical protein
VGILVHRLFEQGISPVSIPFQNQRQWKITRSLGSGRRFKPSVWAANASSILLHVDKNVE